MDRHKPGSFASADSLPRAPSRLVTIWKGGSRYPDGPLYHPFERYAEYPFANTEGAANPVYEGVRASLRTLDLDDENYGTAAWNPLGTFILPGDTVLIKPNWIRQGHASHPDEWEQVITHPSVIRAILDYVYIALKGSGRVVIADGPQTDSDFAEICRRASLRDLCTFFRTKGLDVALLDLRTEQWLQRDGVTYRRRALPGDPLGRVTIDLKEASEFRGYRPDGRFYGADYDVRDTAAYHSGGRHAYVLCRTVMDADVIINLPKMKTHKKTGVTLSLKNLVGVNGHRNCLPHYTFGTPADGGDESPDGGCASKIERAAVARFKRRLALAGGCGGLAARWAVRLGKTAFGSTDEVIRSGNWHGNDTLWRAVLDLNKTVFYFDGAARERPHPIRYLTLVDGIIAGEGNGPLAPDRKNAGLLVAGLNPVAVDTVCATLMGFDFQKIPLLRNAWRVERYPLVDFRAEDILCKSNVAGWCGYLQDLSKAEHLGFRPHFGWIGHIERGEGDLSHSCPRCRTEPRSPQEARALPADGECTES